MNRFGLDRFKKAQSVEPFSVNPNGAKVVAPSVQTALIQPPQSLPQPPPQGLQRQAMSDVQGPAQSTTIGGGASTWHPPDWAAEPKPGLHWLDVVKDGEVVDKIALDKRRSIFGRQIVMCDYVLDHPSVSRQHAAVVQHKNGSIYVIDLGSVHGTFVANERLSKDNPVELEVGQSLRFAASTRSYVLRKAMLPLPSAIQPPVNVVLPPPPDPSDEEALVAYNTILNRIGGQGSGTSLGSSSKSLNADERSTEMKSGEEERRAKKKPRKSRVTFRDTHDGVLVEVVGYSDGADVSTEPGPIGVREGSLIGKYESLVQVTVIPKDQQNTKPKLESDSSKGVTQRLQQYLDKVKAPGKGGLYGDLYGGSLSGVVGGSWAGGGNIGKSAAPEAEVPSSANDYPDQKSFSEKSSVTKVFKTEDGGSSVADFTSKGHVDFGDDDLFGDSA
ncbi:hypothetical protein O6H91_14G031400 [Diphasiastrum complanatum]|uniref:Uncharacterized protein n=2 Tax=Diphasiastrum complanatum TaxID=34168 RepID=A0ACC2BMS6_DIPCM|nr:hypothetical protein O6H91_14G031400 [Diphasiastrum complanatum]KAJ7531072.1 hypothetical protein O6H91_14G031400 [Diphasiastrum complanatum]